MNHVRYVEFAVAGISYKVELAGVDWVAELGSVVEYASNLGVSGGGSGSAGLDGGRGFGCCFGSGGCRSVAGAVEGARGCSFVVGSVGACCCFKRADSAEGLSSQVGSSGGESGDCRVVDSHQASHGSLLGDSTPVQCDVGQEGATRSVAPSGGGTARQCSGDVVRTSSVDSVPGERVVGRWHASNVKKRERRRFGKVSFEKNLRMQGSWRSGVRDGSDEAPSSYFSECDGEIRKELRESRAKMFIAQNNLRAQKAEKGIKAMNSVQGIVQQMVDVSTAIAKLQKQSTDKAVQGWARTVATSMSRSITESSSSVPSLDSVGFGASGLCSTDGEVLDPARVAAYERDIKYVEDSFAAMEAYSEDDYKFAINEVKQAFADVAFTKSQRDVVASKASSVQRLLALGVDYHKIQEALYPDDE